MTNRLFHRYSNWIVDKPAIPILLITVLGGIAMVGHVAPDRVYQWLYAPTDVSAESTARASGTSSGDSQVEIPNVNPFSLADADAAMVVESDGLFTPRGAAILRRVVERLREADHVARVVWMDEIPTANIFGLPEPLLPHETASQARFDHAKAKALKNPLIHGQFLSTDADTTVLLIKFNFFFVRDNDDCVGGLRKIAEDAALEISPDALEHIQFSVTGYVPIRITAMSRHELDKYKYQIIGYMMILIMALILFRGVSSVLIVAIAPIMGVFWTIGLLPYFELQYNPFTDIVLPVLVSLVGLTDGVHLMVHIRKLRASGLSAREATRQGIHEVGLACFLTSLTTGIGFAALSMASHATVREFGWCCVIGVTCTFCSVITTIPLLCASRLGRNVHRGLEKSLIDRNLTRIGGMVEYVISHATFFSWFGIGLTMTLAAICLRLEPDERRTEGLPMTAEPVVALGKMDAALGGLELANVEVGWDDAIASDSDEVLATIVQIDDLLRSEPLIGHPISIRNLIDSLPGDPQAANRMQMLELLPPELKRAFYSPERHRAKILFRVQDIGIAQYGPVFERIQSGLETIRNQRQHFTVTLGGDAVWRWENVYTILIDLVKSLATASFIIFLCLSVAYRSVRIGLISIIPNMFPLVLSASYLVLAGFKLEFVGVCALTICLGIAVDDTIHFLTRYTEALKVSSNREQAIRDAFTGVGTALIMTTVVLLAGFVTVAFGDAREVRIFSALGSITIGSALLGDLLFLPALLLKFGPKQPRD